MTPATPVPLHAFTIQLADTTTTSAVIKWTSAGDSSGKSVLYTVILDSAVVASRINNYTYSFANLKPNTTHTVSIKAFNSINDSLTATITFTTQDTYLKFARTLFTNAVAYDIAFTPEHGYMITFMNGADTDVNNQIPLELMKTDSLGNIIWTKRFGYTYDARQSKIKATSNGYIVSGWDYVMKIDYSGNIIWSSVFDSLGINFTSCLETSSHEFIITGTALAAFVMKLDSAGQLIWKRTYWDSTLYPTANDVVEIAAEHSYIVLGTGNEKFFLWKIDSQGNVLWENDWGTTYSFAQQIKLSNNQLLVAGYIWGGLELSQMAVYRLDLNGHLLKTTPVSNLGFENEVGAMELTQDGGYVVSALIGGPDISYGSIFKYDLNDNLQWENNFNSAMGYIYTTRQTPDGGYVLAPGQRHQSTIWLVKTNNLGQF